jgi:hypothetical protein
LACVWLHAVSKRLPKNSKNIRFMIYLRSKKCQRGQYCTFTWNGYQLGHKRGLCSFVMYSRFLQSQPVPHQPLYGSMNVGANPHDSPTPKALPNQHPNNIIYVSSEDEWNRWLYAAIVTLGF